VRRIADTEIQPTKNVLALAASAKYFGLPTILTTSFENGPNGPLVPEIKEMFPDAPYIARPGNINAWDNEEFVQAVRDTGCKQLIIAGVVTEVCVAFPALSAIEAGFEVFIVTDASGTFNDVTRLMNWFGVACKLHRDWHNDVEGPGQFLNTFETIETSSRATRPETSAKTRALITRERCIQAFA